MVRRGQAWSCFHSLPCPRPLQKGKERELGTDFKLLSQTISGLGFSVTFSFIYSYPGKIVTLM